METSRPKVSRKMLLLPIIGVAAFFLYIYLFQVDIPAIIATARNVNPVWYAIAIFFSLVEVLFYAVSWRTLTSFLSIKMTLTKAYLYVWYGIYVDIIVPAESISGEITRTYLLTRDQCGPCGKVVASLFTHRLVGMAMNVIVLALGVAMLSIEGQVALVVFNSIVIIAIGITVLLILMIVFSFKEKWSRKAINGATLFIHVLTLGKLKARIQKLKGEAYGIMSSFHEAMKEFGHNPKPVVISLFYLGITWFFNLSVSFFVFLSLGNPVSWSLILVTSAIVLAVKSIPVGIPFEVGIPEAAMTTLYLSMGVSPAMSATATILVRIITLWLRFIVGFAVQQWLELKPVITNNGNVSTEKPKMILNDESFKQRQRPSYGNKN